MRITEVENYSDFIALEDRWKSLVQRCDNSIFSTWEWLATWWKHFGQERKLRVLVARDENKILGIAPLMLSQYNLLRLGKFRRIEFIGNQDADYNDFILVEEKTKCLTLFMDYLNEFSDWDSLELCEINEESFSTKALLAMSSSRTPKLELNVSHLCPYISLPTSTEVFAASLGSNMRKNLHRYMRKLQKDYKVEFKTHRDFDSTKEAMEAFFRLHQKRWESKGMSGAFADKTSQDFHIDLAEVFNQKDWLALYFLTANDEPIAAAYTFDYNEKKHARLTGFDPDFSNFRVGSLLKMHIVEDCIRKGLEEYNLSRGAGFGKEYWSTGVRKNYNMKMFNTNFRGQLFSYARKLLNTTLRPNAFSKTHKNS
jgi:CelD/BcsL family acetyltransferase involved in cellulose biosynthesis